MNRSAAIADLPCESSFVKGEAFFILDSEISLTSVLGIFRFLVSRFTLHEKPFTEDTISSLDRAWDPERVEGRRPIMWASLPFH